MNFTQNYSMEYFTHNGGGKTQVRFLLRLKDYDISSWTSSQGSFGIWLGVGFGKTVMDGSDIVHCQYAFSNNSAVDKFVCNDRYASGYQLPPLDSVRNTADVNTNVVIKRQVDGKFMATFEATFDRPVNTGDIVQDKPILMSSMNNLIWAFGQLTNSNPTAHGTTSNDRGGLNNFFVIQLPSSAISLFKYSFLVAMIWSLYIAF
jgi:hypothetical protein